MQELQPPRRAWPWLLLPIALACAAVAHLRSPYGSSSELDELARSVLNPRSLARVVDASLDHGPPPEIPAINWLYRSIAGLGLAPDESQDPTVALARGRGLCHNAAALAIQVARTKGWSAVMIDLGEHVVAEVDTGLGPWIVDGDFGIAQPGGLADLVSRPELRQAWLDGLSQRGASDASVDAVALALARRGAHRRIDGWNLSPRLAAIERSSYWASLLLPSLLLGAWLRVTRRRRRVRPEGGPEPG